MVETIFQVECTTQFGQEVRIVGSTEAFGRWDSARAFRLETTATTYPQWRSKPFILPESEDIEYKFIIVADTGSVVWEKCHNRQVPQVQPGSCDAMLIKDYFGRTEHDRVVLQKPCPVKRTQSPTKRNPAAVQRSSQSQPTQHSTVGPSPKSCRKERSKSTSRKHHGTPHKSSSGLRRFSSVNCCEAEPCSPSRITKSRSTDKLNASSCDKTNGTSERSVLIWPQVAGTSCVELLGSFTDPPWEKRIPMSLCTESGVWWVSLQEKLPGLKSGTYEFKFLVNGSLWRVDPALPSRVNAQGF